MESNFISQMQESITGCTRCRDLVKVKCGQAPGLFCRSQKPNVMIIGHSPKTDTKSTADYVLNMDKPTRAIYKYITHEILELLSIGIDNIYCTNLLKCFTVEKPEVIKKTCKSFISDMADNCSDHLESEICAIKPKIIISLSESALKHISARYLGGELGMREHNANLFTFAIGGFQCHYVPLIHIPTGPNGKRIEETYLASQREKLRIIGNQLQKELTT